MQENIASKEAEIAKQKEEIIAFAKKMRVAADSTRTKCVDGGYRAGEAEGAIAFPGGHLGISMALLKLGLSPREAFDLVYKFSSKDSNPYCWHTDTHEGHGSVVGCGHCNAAIGNAEHYGVESDAVKELLEIVRKEQENSENMETVILDRDHAEKAILVVTSIDFSVKPWDEEDDVQYFIYDKTRHLEMLKELVEYAKENGKDISYEDLVAASDEQLNSTLGLLGSSKGKMIFTVDMSSEEPVVEYVGDAPVIE